MKRTDRLTSFIAALLFLALLAYIGVYVLRALRSTTVTAEAVAADFSLTGTASGIVIREETVLTSAARDVFLTAEEGVRVAAGGPVATAADSDQAALRAARVRELEAEIDRVSAALEGSRTAGDLTARDASLTKEARLLASAVARHDLPVLENSALKLNSLLIGVDSAEISEERLAELRRELDSLRNSTVEGEAVLTAPTSGVFSSAVDGYEHLTPAALRDLTPAALQALTESRREPASGAYGKLVTGYRWYFAAAMSEADAAGLVPGRSVVLSFGRGYGAETVAAVDSVSAPEEGTVAVVFCCDTGLADTLTLRTVTAQVVLGSYSGIRVPAQALQTDPDTGETYVWTVTAMQLERKSAECLYTGEDFVILRRAADAGALREGNTVVVSGEDLYEGKVME